MAAIFFKQVLQSMWGEEHLLQDGTELLFVFVLEQLAIQVPWILKIFKCRPSGLNFVIRVIFNIKKKHLSIFVCYVSGHICIGPFFWSNSSLGCSIVIVFGGDKKGEELN